jgi:hypothetical protein
MTTSTERTGHHPPSSEFPVAKLNQSDRRKRRLFDFFRARHSLHRMQVRYELHHGRSVPRDLPTGRNAAMRFYGLAALSFTTVGDFPCGEEDTVEQAREPPIEVVAAQRDHAVGARHFSAGDAGLAQLSQMIT